jgi:hypothetical protein
MKIKMLEKLDLPPQSKVEAELLKLLAFNSRPLSTTEIYQRLADTFGLTASQRVARRQATRLDPAWNWLVRRVMQRLEAEGWAYRPERAAWVVTQKGRSQQQLRQQGLPDIFAEEESVWRFTRHLTTDKSAFANSRALSIDSVTDSSSGCES